MLKKFVSYKTSDSQTVFCDTLMSPIKFTVSRKLPKFSFSLYHEKLIGVCREISDFGLVCRGSKSLGNTIVRFDISVVYHELVIPQNR
jgi:hypothetical protein